MMKRRIISLFISFGLIVCFHQALMAQSQKKELKEVKEKLAKEKKSLLDLVSKKTSILDVVDQLDRKLNTLTRERNRLKGRIDEVEENIQTTLNNIQKQEREIEKTDDLVNRRMVALYKMGEMGSLKILFSSKGISDFLQTNHYLRLVIENDLNLITTYNEQLQKLEQSKSDLEVERDKLNTLRREVDQNRNNVLAKREKRQTVLAAISSEEKIRKQYIEELEEASRNLEKLLKDLHKQNKQRKRKTKHLLDRGFAARKGSLQPPVEGKILRKFGKFQDPKFFTYSFHKGIDIGAGRGAQIKSVFDGKVVYSGWFKGFGQMIIVDHGGGYHTLAAHNQELFKNVGDAVQEGDIVGRASTELTDRASGSARIYFEVREKGKSVDPLQWLSKSGFL